MLACARAQVLLSETCYQQADLTKVRAKAAVMHVGEHLLETHMCMAPAAPSGPLSVALGSASGKRAEEAGPWVGRQKLSLTGRGSVTPADEQHQSEEGAAKPEAGGHDLHELKTAARAASTVGLPLPESTTRQNLYSLVPNTPGVLLRQLVLGPIRWGWVEKFVGKKGRRDRLLQDTDRLWAGAWRQSDSVHSCQWGRQVARGRLLPTAVVIFLPLQVTGGAVPELLECSLHPSSHCLPQGSGRCWVGGLGLGGSG